MRLALIPFIFVILSCNKDNIEPKIFTGFTEYTFKEGNHYSTPLATRFMLNGANLTGEAYFTQFSIYNLEDEDQLDWNKLVGLKLDYNPVPNHSAMVAWRYNDKTKYFEVSPYFNNNGLILPTQKIVLKPYEVFQWSVQLNGDEARVSVKYKTQEITKYQKLKKQKLYTSVSPWFGGNRAAPHEVSLFLKFN